MMGRITGSGCMLDGVIGAFLAAEAAGAKQVFRQAGCAAAEAAGAEQVFRQTVYAVAAEGICGELAYEKTMRSGGGTATFRMHFIDAMSLLTDEDIRRMSKLKFDLHVYAVTDRSWTGKQTLLEQLETALQAGVTLVQLREKELDQEAFIEEAKAVKALTDRYGVPLLINDNVEVAIACGAAGVHVGQEDLEAGRVRELLGPDKIIGVTAKTIEQARRAEAAGADYLGSGAVFGSTTKKNAKPMTKELLTQITHAVSIPVVAIGGINRHNILELAGTGIAGAAVVSGIFAEEDIEAAVRELKEKVNRIVGA